MVEYFAVVDKNDKIIGKASREECHADRNLTHRASAVIVFNSKGEILFEKRSMEKDMEPGAWGLVAGHVDFGESYGQAADREMIEEIGVKCKKLKPLFKIFFASEEETEIIKCFSCIHDGPFKVNKEESDGVRFFSRGKIKDALKTGSIRITSSDIQVLKRLFALKP